MAYKQVKKYGYRDSLEKGDPEKVIYGVDFDAEFEAIEEAIAALDPNADGGVDIDEIDGLGDALDGKADKDHTHDEYLTDAPDDGAQYVRESGAWAEVTIPEAGISEPTSDGKPYSRQVEGGQTVGAWVEAPTADDIEYLDGRIDAIEGNISGGGGFVEAPDDGGDYARNGKSPAWVKTYNAEYIDALEADYKNADAGKADKDHNHAISDVTGLQTALDGKANTGHNHDSDYAPIDHAHTTDEITGLDDKISDLEGDITDLEGAVGELTGQLAMGGSYNASTGLVVTANLSSFTAGQPLPDYSAVPNTFVIVVEAGNNPEELGEGDWLVAGQSGWVAIKYGTAGSVDWDNITNVPDFDLIYAPIDHTGHIEDGTINGQIATWDVAKKEWTPEGAVVVSDGKVGIGISPEETLDVKGSLAVNQATGVYWKSGNRDTTNVRFFWNDTASDARLMSAGEFQVRTGGFADANQALTIDAAGDVTLTGKIITPRAELVGSNNTNVLLKISGSTANTNMSANGRLWREEAGGIQFAGTALRCLDGDGAEADGALDIGRTSHRFNNGFFAGTVDAGGFTVNGVPIGGGGGLPDGGYTYGWSITATDFIATSDERAKDNITTAPVGLIDSLKGREWDWKESGEKGSGVVAQELEQVLPHLVHTDDEGMKSVSYMGLCAYLIEEVKALKAEVEALKS